MLVITKTDYELRNLFNKAVKEGISAVHRGNKMIAINLFGRAQVYRSMLNELGIDPIDSLDDYYDSVLSERFNMLINYIYDFY